MFDAPSMTPGETVRSTIHLSYEGDAPAEIRLYGSTEGIRFARFLQLEVTRGDYTLYRGSLADFPETYESGAVDPTVWLASTDDAYRFDVTLVDGAKQPPAGATQQTFTWEARSV